jgi:hypothetical protein
MINSRTFSLAICAIFGELFMATSAEFLEIQSEKKSELNAFGSKSRHCGQYVLQDMKPIKYGDWNLRVWPKPLGSGTTSRVTDNNNGQETFNSLLYSQFSLGFPRTSNARIEGFCREPNWPLCCPQIGFFGKSRQIGRKRNAE